MRSIWLIASCCAIWGVLVVACDRRKDVPTLVLLGELGGANPEDITLKVDVPSVYPYPWMIGVFADASEKVKYLQSELIITVINTDMNAIMTEQVDEVDKPGFLTTRIEPKETKVIYRGTVGSFVGFDERREEPSLGFWSPDSKRLKCLVRLQRGKSDSFKPVKVGLSRTEPLL